MKLRKRSEATQKQRQAGRKASWLKQVRKVKRIVKERQSEKWVTRPRGGEKKKKTLVRKTKTIGAKNKNKMRKDRITYIDKSTTRVQ